MYLRTIFVILISSLLTTSCFSQKQEPSLIDWKNLQIPIKTDDNLCVETLPEELDTGEGIKQDFTAGLAIGFLPTNLSAPHKIAYDTYWVNADEKLSFNWLFWYPKGNEGPLNLRLFVLLDDQQLVNVLPQPGSYNDLQLNKGDDITLQVAIPPLAAGVHDVIAIAIASPQNDPDVYGKVDLLSNRITLIVEPTSSSPFRKINFTPLAPEGSVKRNDPALVLELTLKSNEIKVWNWPDPWLTVNSDTPIHFYALAGHEDVTNVDVPSLPELEESFFSLLLFSDYQQVEIAPNQMALYGKVDKDTAYTRFSLELPPLSEGEHRILVLRVDTPGVPVCLLKGNPKGRFLPNSVYGKLVGIKVFPPK
jgi:hypothetical protein